MVRRLPRLLAWGILFALVLAAAPGTVGPETRTLEIETSEITRPDVAVASDGSWLAVTALGHLFRVPASGGKAEQLTFGPWYDSDPAISPDGSRIVFSSDRSGESNGNLFLLDLESGELERLTDESWAARPVWAPDGASIGYLSYESRGLWAEYEFVAEDGVAAHVRRLVVGGGEPETLTERPGLVRSTFFLQDGRQGWAILGGDESETRAHDLGAHARPAPTQSTLIAESDSGREVLAVVNGVVDRIVPDASAGGFYVRRYGIPASGFLVPQPEGIAHLTFEGEERSIIGDLESPQPRPAFGVAAGEIYLGDRGRLWRVDASSGEREAIEILASIEMDVFPPSEPPGWEPGSMEAQVGATVLDPRPISDGGALVFTAAGYLWQQRSGESARRVTSDEAFEWSAAISPDGRRVAYQASEGNVQHLRVADLEAGLGKSLVTVDRTGRFEPAWSPDGNRLVYVGFKSSVPSLYLLDLDTGKSRRLVDAFPRWMPRPQFSPDGKRVTYTALGQLQRISVEGGESETVTALSPHAADFTVSPDGQWLAFRRNEEIWLTPFGDHPITDGDARRLSTDGGLNFGFSSDSQSIVYATGSQVWRQPLDGRDRTQMIVTIDLPREMPAPTLLRDVRVLDFEAGGFSEPTSMLIEDGRIAWIGPESEYSVPSAARVIEARGRFAIPGLFDSHTHVATPIHFNPARDVSNMASNIAHGVTSVRDMGSDITLVGAWSDRREHFGAPVPRIFSYGAMTEVAGPFFHGGSFFVATEDEARALVQKERRDGAAGIKSYFTMPWRLQRTVADEARRQGMPVAAHGLTFREIVMDPVLGRASIEHQPSPIRVYDDVLQLLAETGVRWDPTIAPIGGNGVLFAQEPHLLSDARLRAFTSKSDYAMAEEVALFSVLDPKVIGRAYAELLASVREGHAMGVKLLAGTDALNPNVFYGHGLHTELWHFARAGLPPIDVLRMATLEAATAVGAEEHLGSLEAGKLADVVLLDENPLLDVRNALSVWRVVLEGRVFASEPTLTEM